MPVSGDFEKWLKISGVAALEEGGSTQQVAIGGCSVGSSESRVFPNPVVQARPEPPSPELVELHEVTHLPRADWCEACIAARSREDSYEAAGPKREFPVISLDFMFVKTDGEDAPLATHLVCVDSQSKYVVAVALAAEGGKTLKHAVEEVVGMLTVLGYAKVFCATTRSRP